MVQKFFKKSVEPFGNQVCLSFNLSSEFKLDRVIFGALKERDISQQSHKSFS